MSVISAYICLFTQTRSEQKCSGPPPLNTATFFGYDSEDGPLTPARIPARPLRRRGGRKKKTFRTGRETEGAEAHKCYEGEGRMDHHAPLSERATRLVGGVEGKKHS